ncbi:MAG TPA: methyltransferase [Candidatus Acidoferrales bacterium]|jgi:protein-S-isoprenylcysteine O-methyltransferase Ste14|nr:methyltransferase [Candidatus Acidoferrales bacterium]
MSTSELPASKAEENLRSPFHELLGNPWFDRAMAVIACIPFVFFGYFRYRHGGLTIPLVALWIELALLIVPMIIRRPPKRVSLNPAYWVLTFVETYWLLVPILGPGRRIVPSAVSDGLALLALAVVIWGRLSLGRNIAFIPAQRELVTKGAYTYMRHPIYTSLFIVYLSVALDLYSVRNVILIAIGMFWFVLKSVVEERFLREDPRYAAYMQRVRARWIPFVV